MAQFIDIHTHNPSTFHPSPQGVGIHPWDVEKVDWSEELFSAATLIGECGLDYACPSDRALQERVFREQLALAVERDLPVVIHSVRAFEPVMLVLKDYPLRAVIFHGFIGSQQMAQRAVARGYYLSFGEGAFRSPKTLLALRYCPLENLFAETDQSEIGIEQIYVAIARERGISIEELAAAIENNYRKIFLQNNDR